MTDLPQDIIEEMALAKLAGTPIKFTPYGEQKEVKSVLRDWHNGDAFTRWELVKIWPDKDCASGVKTLWIHLGGSEF